MLNDRSEVGLVSPELELDLQSDNHISLYNPAYSAAQWRKERTRINQEYPVIVFSKVRSLFSHLVTADSNLNCLQSYCQFVRNFYRFFMCLTDWTGIHGVPRNSLGRWNLDPLPKLLRSTSEVRNRISQFLPASCKYFLRRRCRSQGILVPPYPPLHVPKYTGYG